MNQSSAFCHQFVECGSRIGNPWLGFPAIDFRIFRHLRYNSRMTTSDRELYELEQIVDELRRPIQVLLFTLLFPLILYKIIAFEADI